MNLNKHEETAGTTPLSFPFPMFFQIFVCVFRLEYSFNLLFFAADELCHGAGTDRADILKLFQDENVIKSLMTRL